MPGIGIGLGLTLGGGGGALTDTAIARALATKGLSDAQARAAIGGAATLATGLRAIGLMPAAATPTPAPTPTPTPTPTPSPAPPGFALNGSSNSALKAMLAAKTGIIVISGDSTNIGHGGGVTANATASSGDVMLANARPYRPAALIAGLMTAAGCPAFDNAFVGSGALTTGAALSAYDTRIGGTVWPIQYNSGFSGGSYFTQDPGGGTMTFTPTSPIDRFEVWLYNTGGGANLQVDGAKPAGVTVSTGGTVDSSPGAYTSITSSQTNSGLTRVVVSCANLGIHTLGFSSGSCALRGVRGYSSAAPGIHFIVDAGNGLKSGDQATTGYNWSNRDTIAFDAPKLVIVNLGLNDANQNVSISTFQANLQSLVATATAAGADVLVLAPNAASADFASFAAQDQMHAAAAATAASSNVAFGDIRAALGDWASTAARTADNLAHPNRGYYGDIGAYMWSCIRAMAA